MRKLIILLLLSGASLASAQQNIQPYLNILYKANIQDTYKKTPEGLYYGKTRTYTGDYFLTAIEEQSGYGVIGLKEELRNLKEPSTWRIELGKGNTIYVYDLNEKKKHSLKVAKEFDDKKKLKGFVLKGSELQKIIKFKSLNAISAEKILRYGFSSGQSSTYYKADSYRCYIRRKLLRCFSDVNLVQRVE